MRHHNCGGTIYVDISSAFQLWASVSTLSREQRLITTRIIFEQQINVLKDFNYVCQRCHNTVELKHIMENCRSCSKRLNAKDIFIPKESNGCFCKKCYEDMFAEEESVTLAEILSVQKLHIV